MHGLRVLLPGQGVNGHLVCHHERGIKSQSEMADNLILVGLVLVLCHKVLHTGERDLIDVLVNLLLGHAQAVVRDLDGLLLLVHTDLDLVVHILGLLILAHELQFL